MVTELLDVGCPLYEKEMGSQQRESGTSALRVRRSGLPEGSFPEAVPVLLDLTTRVLRQAMHEAQSTLKPIPADKGDDYRYGHIVGPTSSPEGRAAYPQGDALSF